MEVVINHLLLGVLVLIIYYIFRINNEKRATKWVFQTADGYRITLHQLMKLSKAAEREIESSIRTQGILVCFTFLPYILGYLMSWLVGLGIEKLWGIPSILITSLYAPVVLIVSISHMYTGNKAVKRELTDLANGLTFTTPDKFSHYGKYITDLVEFQNLSHRLMKQELEVKRIKESKEILELQQNQVKVKLSEEKSREITEKLLGEKLRLMTKNEKILITLKQIEHILSDEIPEAYADILNQKLDNTMVANEKFVPHHIQVLMEISKDTALPEDMRKDAEESLQLYVSKQLKEAKEKSLQDVQLDLTIAKKMMEEE